jgi:hypothetical protein
MAWFSVKTIKNSLISEIITVLNSNLSLQKNFIEQSQCDFTNIIETVTIELGVLILLQKRDKTLTEVGGVILFDSMEGLTHFFLEVSRVIFVNFTLVLGAEERIKCVSAEDRLTVEVLFNIDNTVTFRTVVYQPSTHTLVNVPLHPTPQQQQQQLSCSTDTGANSTTHTPQATCSTGTPTPVEPSCSSDTSITQHHETTLTTIPPLLHMPVLQDLVDNLDDLYPPDTKINGEPIANVCKKLKRKTTQVGKIKSSNKKPTLSKVLKNAAFSDISDDESEEDSPPLAVVVSPPFGQGQHDKGIRIKDSLTTEDVDTDFEIEENEDYNDLKKTSSKKKFNSNIEPEKLKADNGKYGFSVDGDVEQFLETVDDLTSSRYKPIDEILERNVTIGQENMVVISSYLQKMQKLVKQIHTRKGAIECNFCCIHCPPRWKLTGPAGRPYKKPQK